MVEVGGSVHRERRYGKEGWKRNLDDVEYWASHWFIQ